jgi:hypothetical protein
VGGDVGVAEAFPDAEVAVIGGGGVGGQHLEEGGQLVGAPVRVNVVLAVAGAYWIGQEPKPGVGVEAGGAEADELLPRQVAVDDPVGGRQVPTAGEPHVPVLPPSPGPAHPPGVGIADVRTFSH